MCVEIDLWRIPMAWWTRSPLLIRTAAPRNWANSGRDTAGATENAPPTTGEADGALTSDLRLRPDRRATEPPTVSGPWAVPVSLCVPLRGLINHHSPCISPHLRGRQRDAVCAHLIEYSAEHVRGVRREVASLRRPVPPYSPGQPQLAGSCPCAITPKGLLASLRSQNHVPLLRGETRGDRHI